MKYSVVIPSKTPVNLMACLGAIVLHEPELERDRIVVVDDSDGGAEGTIAHICRGFRVTRLDGERPFIFSRNANIGLRHAFGLQDARAVILLNDDALLKVERGFTSLVNAQAQVADLGICSASTNSVGNVNQNPAGYQRIRREAKMLCFICVSITAACWHAVGELDEAYCLDYGCEDGDYSYRARLAGQKLGVFDPCFVDHRSLKSTYRAAGPMSFERNGEVFRKKFGIDYRSEC